jgi:hypothetical protein
MLLTDKFVFVHLPKTGGTFVKRTMAQVYGIKHRRTAWDRLMLKLRGVPFEVGGKHDPCSAIPPAYRHLPIVSSYRNPYALVVSHYRFAWWRRRFEAEYAAAIAKRFPSWPDLSFEEFLEMSQAFFERPVPADSPRADEIGFLSRRWFRFFLKDPSRTPAVDDVYLRERQFERDAHPVRFLRTENLNRDLHACLLDLGYPKERIECVLTAEKVRPKTGGAEKPADAPWQSLYTPKLVELVRRRERLLFALFPEYDVTPS